MLTRSRTAAKPQEKAVRPEEKARRPKAKAVAPSACADLLLEWYDRHRRRLPWRALPGATPDPYAVWLSEIMLQQTTVTAVKPYYENFLAKWPAVRALAEAPVEDVMKAWAGLGYYSRARNLHACARRVESEFGGVFPSSEEELRKLPGIGPYTAAAIAAIAFGCRAVVVDGNVERVVARLFRIQTPLPAAKPAMRARADEITPEKRAGDFAQAMMDLGATLCSPKNPACSLCPLNGMCAAFRAGDAATYPRRGARAERPQRFGAVFYLRRVDGYVLVRTRPPKGLLGGMTEFPGTVWSADFDASHALAFAPARAAWNKQLEQVEHVFTHFALKLDVYVAQAKTAMKAPEGMRFVPESELDGEALPSVMRKVMAVLD